ncbi:ribonuclease Z [Egicoccus halophilus]|uniref:Ribonuclease Z n=1 Tax=Egicoccus halophilus TaxID=1670830 RepID=A0A8J3ETY5_9ACTN|nr:ribonuclease Z [Egicoccus halophilus]GGI06556.1 ribonuclease Z [Egicoccus halophilus]
MSTRQLVVLGTASQVPTRTRNHNGHVLLWDELGILFDPGEGTQRQLTHAGLPVSRIDHVCITHAHGDHCLGLPGVLQRRALDGLSAPVTVHHPRPAADTIARLRDATPYEATAPVVLRGVELASTAPLDLGPVTLRAAPLEHGEPAVGWRIDEPDGWRADPELLAAARVPGPLRRELLREGRVEVDGRMVRREEVAVPRPGQSMAFVMDTRDCDGARELAAGVDLLVIEATFLDDQRALAEEVGHLTATQAARIGAECGARRVVLTHFSQRYPDLTEHLAQARAAAPGLDIHVAADLDRVDVPPRR